MINIGKTNTLKVSRLVEFGAYLTDDTAADTEILLPRRYVDENLRPGDEIEVFVYNDSEDRPVATTERPIAQVGEVAVLEVVGTCRYGAFLYWGLPKDLLVPFGEQRARMKMGGHYPVFIYLDDASKRIVASARLGKFLGNLLPSFLPDRKWTRWSTNAPRSASVVRSTRFIRECFIPTNCSVRSALARNLRLT